MFSKSETLRQVDVKSMVRVALFAALLAVFSQIAIPLPMVPINLALLAVYMAGFALERRGALLAVSLYLLLGAAGVPVFAGFRGGVTALFDKTGGYLLGYLATAGVVVILKPWANTFAKRVIACTLGLLCCYVLGTAWFMLLTGLSLPVSLGYCIYPFIPGDAIKIFVAASSAPQLQKALSRI